MALPPFTPYFPIAVAANLQFVDTNGVPVTQMYPTGATQQLDGPTTGYISRIGAKVSDLITQGVQVNALLAAYNTRIIYLENTVAAILSSGVTFMLYVNGGCLDGNISVPITTSVTSLVANTCAYNTILGTTTALAVAVAAEGASTLNSLPAYSQNSAMAGLVGWVSLPTTIADSEKNQWLAYNDMRVGVNNALAGVTPTCASVMVNWMVNFTGNAFNLYFNGYTFIPTGFTDIGSQIRIYDNLGNTLIQPFNIVTQSTTQGPYTIGTSGSTLAITSGTTYTVYVDSSVHNTSLVPAITCQKTTVVTGLSISSGVGLSTIGTLTGVITGGSANDCCPVISNYTASTSGTTSFPVTITGLSFTPRYVNVVSKNTYTSNLVLSHTPYFTYFAGGFIISLVGSSPTLGTTDFDWIAYR